MNEQESLMISNSDPKQAWETIKLSCQDQSIKELTNKKDDQQTRDQARNWSTVPIGCALIRIQARNFHGSLQWIQRTNDHPLFGKFKGLERFRERLSYEFFLLLIGFQDSSW